MYPPDKLRKFPHLMVSDIRIWERYLETVDHRFSSFDYDVHVGEGVKVAEETLTETDMGAPALLEKRIDVVGWANKIPTVIEVKPGASMSAIGQVLSYRELFIERFKDSIHPLMMIVTDREMIDTKSLCTRFGIKLVVVGLGAVQ